MKYTYRDLANEIGFTEAWIRDQEYSGKLKLKAKKTRGQGQKRLFDSDDVEKVKSYAKSKLNKRKVYAQWRLLHG